MSNTDRYRYTYEHGLKDGFVDGCIVTLPHNTGGHTIAFYLSVKNRYTQCVIRPRYEYENGYASGVDCAAVYFGYAKYERKE